MPESPPPSDVASEALQAAHHLPRSIPADAETLLLLGLDAVALASARAGAPTAVGRVEQTAPGRREFRFVPTDGERLEVVWYDDQGRPVETRFLFSELEVRGASGAEALEADHVVAAEVVIPDRLELELRTRRAGARVEASTRGWLRLEGHRIEAALDVRGERRGEVGLAGSSAETALQTTGQLRGPGFEIQVEERFRAETVTARDEAASSSTSRLGHRVQTGARELRFEDVVIQRSFRDGQPSDLGGFWRADGRVTAGGEPVGRYRLTGDLVDRTNGQGFVIVELVTPDGPLELERWQRS